MTVSLGLTNWQRGSTHRRRDGRPPARFGGRNGGRAGSIRARRTDNCCNAYSAGPCWDYLRETAPRILDGNHPTARLSIDDTGTLVLSMACLEEAIPHYCEVLARSAWSPENDHHDALTSINNMGYFPQLMD